MPRYPDNGLLPSATLFPGQSGLASTISAPSPRYVQPNGDAVSVTLVTGHAGQTTTLSGNGYVNSTDPIVNAALANALKGSLPPG